MNNSTQGKFISELTPREQINFLVTNRIPRRWLTLFMGWFSQIQSPLLTRISIKVWSWFADDLKLHEAKKTSFNSLGECFTRQLKQGMREVCDDNDIVTSPCDAIVGACGSIDKHTVYQAKGFPYQITELIPDFLLANKYKNGTFVTLRLKSSMYHRFHAPIDCSVKRVNYISGDTWNVNPIALKKVEKLFCKNERAVVELETNDSVSSITLVPVAAVLVASMKFNFLDETLDLRYKGPNNLHCQGRFEKGDEMGYFQHGSTIIVFATENYRLCEHLESGMEIKMGEPLLTGHQDKQTHETTLKTT